jgi:hypothetical protein
MTRSNGDEVAESILDKSSEKAGRATQNANGRRKRRFATNNVPYFKTGNEVDFSTLIITN